MRVLVTGAAGFVGRHVTRSLSDHFDLRLGDIQSMDDPRWISCDITDPASVRAAMEGVDAVLHLAMASGLEGSIEDDAFNQVRFDVHVRGTFNVLKAAADAGAKRVIHTSSIMVVWGYEPPEWVAGDAPAKPVGTYAITKMLGEVACAEAARQWDLSILGLRIAKPVEVDNPLLQTHPIRPQWIAIPDLMRAYKLALRSDLEPSSFELITLVGESSQRRWDLSRAELLIGYRPEIRLEDLGCTLGSERAPLV
ncbi:NAD-dependent epimerase/dehydratase family protein [Thalassoroseus pseudoceratinae]|uniref:NAD-dependent epimerase/dehydratase family protein n=1 Tax=Thalassoroseus pseudoceratinae TaxID=2713176 RepID=UPI0014221F96|nr:NAD(P)-dependent oxidoreductase [Thalassoroseus pseudoceratinae]